MGLRHVDVVGVVFVMAGTLGGCAGQELDVQDLQELAQLAQGITGTPRGVVLLDAPRYTAPGTVRITVADSHLNARSSDTEFGRVSLTSTTSPAGRSVTVRETGPDTGVFEGTARLALVATGGELLVQNGDTVTARYRHADDGTGSAATVIATALVDNTAPDLTVALASPGMALAGATVSVTVTTTADATGGAVETPTVLRLWLTDGAGNDVRLADRDVPMLAPGASNVQTVAVTLPAGLNGTYGIRADGDVHGALTERREDNNRAEAPVQVVGADLRVSSLTAPGTAKAGDSIEVTATVTNGATGGVASPSSLRLHLVDTSGNLLAQLADHRIGLLASGAVETVVASVTVPAGVNGGYGIRAIADVYGAVAERDEANNVRDLPIAVSGADLVVGAIGAPAQALAGAEVDITVAVGNGAGEGSASRSTLRLYLADAAGTAIAHLADRGVAALAPGASESGASRVVIPAGLAGDYRIRAIADVDANITERNEANNVRDIPIAVIGADLAVRVSPLAQGVASGGVLEVRATVTNDAVGGAAPSSKLRLHLVDGGGNLVARLTDCGIGALAPGTSHLAIVAVTMPTGLNGKYVVRAIADVNGAVDERDEENNSADAPVAVTGADLVVSQAAAPAAAQPGAAVDLSVTVANRASGGISSPSTLRLYLVDLFGSAVAHLGDRGVPQLAPGESDTSAGEVLIASSVAPGVYAIRAIADVDGRVAETDETDNVRDVASITVGP